MEFGSDVFRFGYLSLIPVVGLLAILAIVRPLLPMLGTWSGKSLAPKTKVSFDIVMVVLLGLVAGGFFQPLAERFLVCGGWTAQ